MKMNILTSFYLIVALIFATCKQSENEKNPVSNGQLIFQSGFENESKVVAKGSDADIIGVDKSFPDHND